jgi:sortase A
VAPAQGEREVQELPVVSADWPRLSREEVAAALDARYYAPQQNAALTLTVKEIGLYDVPVIDGATEAALEQGVIHLPQTPMPWEERDRKNVYLAGHRLGFPDTGSRLVFYNLDKLKEGDILTLEDRSGTPYEYRVSEVFVVEPEADWVVDLVRGRDMVTLQTCTFSDLLNRLIVRADRA